MAIGAVVGLAIGYTVHRATGHSENFITWINPLSTISYYWTDGLAWMMGGLIVGLAAASLPPRNSN
jgi:hypothetical protein